MSKKRVFLQKYAKISSFLSNVFEIAHIFDIIIPEKIMKKKNERSGYGQRRI